MSVSHISNEQIELMKGNMKDTIDMITHENLENCFQVLTSQYQVLKQLYELECLKANVGLVSQENTQEESSEDDGAESGTVIQSESTPRESDERHEKSDTVYTTPFVDDTRPMYKVERKLRGAYIPEIDAYIPEGILRSENIEHGDYVYVESLGVQQGSHKHYKYTLAKKGDGERPDDIVEYLYCPVEKDVFMYIVTRSSATGEMIRIDDAPYTVLISDDDVERFDLNEGDLVDIAFYRSNPSSAKVVWKHEVGNAIPTVTTSKKKTERIKATCEREVCEEQPEQVFLGQTICIVGDKPSEADYRELIEERGGVHLHVEPKWNPSRIENIVKKADVVIGLYDVSGHIGLEKVKEFCKKYGIPFDMISGRGKTKTIRKAMELLNQVTAS